MKTPTIDFIKDQLTRLRSVCEALCQDAEQERAVLDSQGWRVKWESFVPYRAWWTVDDSGDEEFGIIFSGASADNESLKSWMAERIEGMGFQNVRIIFNW